MGLWLDDQLNCTRCRENNWQQDRGCPEITRNHPHIFNQVGDRTYQYCLVGAVTRESVAWLNDYGYLESGIMPEAGGLNDQWELDLQAFQIIGNERTAIEELKRRNQ